MIGDLPAGRYDVGIRPTASDLAMRTIAVHVDSGAHTYLGPVALVPSLLSNLIATAVSSNNGSLNAPNVLPSTK